MLSEKYIRLSESLKNDTRVYSIGIAEKSQYNFEDTFYIYTKIKVENGTYPEIFEGITVKTRYIGEVKIGI